MGDLRTVDAAKLLGVTPSTLRLWQQQYGFPTSLGTPGVGRLFAYDELTLLRGALARGTSIESAIAEVRTSVATGSGSFAHADRVPRLLELIRTACDRDYAVVDLQPIIDLTVGEPVKYEATLRVLDDDGEAISPAMLRRVAERYGLDSQLDLLLVRSTARLAQSGHAVAIALSAASLRDPGMALSVEHVIIDATINASLLTFQLPEWALSQPNAAGLAFARHAQEAGCLLTLTRCGPHEPRLGRLQLRAPDCVNLHHALISELPRSPSLRQSVQTFVDSAHAAGMLVGADRIADDSTRNVLRALDVDQGAGPLWGTPVAVGPGQDPAEAVAAGAGHRGVAQP